MFFNSSELVQSEKPVIFDDSYGGNWEFFGQIIHSSHDYRYEGLGSEFDRSSWFKIVEKYEGK